MELLRVTFPVSGIQIPLDHGYAVFSAISRLVPEVHANREVAIAPIRGAYLAPRVLGLTRFSRLTIIAPLSIINEVLPPDVLIAISMFDSADEAVVSNEKAADWVRNNVMEFARGMPEVMVGDALVAEVK